MGEASDISVRSRWEGMQRLESAEAASVLLHAHTE